MHIYIHICMHMCNKNVQVSSIHGKKWHVHTNAHTNVHFFPVYRWNLYIFITHAHGNSNTNVHFFWPSVELHSWRRYWIEEELQEEWWRWIMFQCWHTLLMVNTRISVLAIDNFDYLKMPMCQHSYGPKPMGKWGTGPLLQQWCY